MNEQEIIEGNKLIAEFMGYKSCFSHIEDKYGYTQTVDGYLITGKYNIGNHQEDEYENFAIDHLKFHQSFDWLMPVVAKIQKLDYVCVIYGNYCNIIEKGLFKKQYEGEGFDFDYYSSSIDTVIEAVWKAVVEFIKYYNKHYEKMAQPTNI